MDARSRCDSAAFEGACEKDGEGVGTLYPPTVKESFCSNCDTDERSEVKLAKKCNSGATLKQHERNVQCHALSNLPVKGDRYVTTETQRKRKLFCKDASASGFRGLATRSLPARCLSQYR